MEQGNYMTIDSIIYKKMVQSKLLQPIYYLLKKVGLIQLAYVVLYWCYSIKPPKHAQYEKTFFIDNKEKLKKVYKMLEDSRSKCVYKSIIMYRTTYEKKYINRTGYNEENQYFVPEIQLHDKEVIVDCGAYTGDTAVKFLKFAPDSKVIALEPDEENVRKLSMIKSSRLKVYNYGAWSGDMKLKFDGGKGGSSLVDERGGDCIEVRALDHLPECQDATYIKMDIEGAELEALKGAQQIIQKNKPKLAVCLYHKPEDFFEIPLYIKSLNPSYKLYVYHHTKYTGETVLYAV